MVCWICSTAPKRRDRASKLERAVHGRRAFSPLGSMFSNNILKRDHVSSASQAYATYIGIHVFGVLALLLPALNFVGLQGIPD